MTAAPAPTRQRPATPTPATAPGRVLTALAVRQVRRGALVVTAVSAGMSALVVATFRSEALDPAALGALARNPAIRTLFGEPVALDDPGGFTVWRTGTVLSVLIGVWGMLAVTRITRGEEDAGRWSMLLSGRPTLTDAVRRHLQTILDLRRRVAGIRHHEVGTSSVHRHESLNGPGHSLSRSTSPAQDVPVSIGAKGHSG